MSCLIADVLQDDILAPFRLDGAVDEIEHFNPKTHFQLQFVQTHRILALPYAADGRITESFAPLLHIHHTVGSRSIQPP